MMKWILFAAVLCFVGRALAKHIAAIDWSLVHPHYGFALLAACAIALVTVSQIVVYRLLLSAYGPPLSWARAAVMASNAATPQRAAQILRDDMSHSSFA